MIRRSLGLSLILLNTILFGQNTINLNNQLQVFYDMEEGIKASISLNDWDIAIEPNGDYGIRLNEVSGARVWAQPNEIEDNCLGILMCRGLQDHIPTNIDTSGMQSGNNGWTELHNSYETWSEGAFNQEKAQLNGDIVTYGWGGYRATNSNPAHAIIGYRIFVVRTQRGDYKQFFVRKSNSAGYDFAYANLDGSGVVERSINRADYEEKMFAYLSLETGTIHNPEPLKTDWDFVITRYPEGKSTASYNSYIGILHHPDHLSELADGSSNCNNPSGSGSAAINTMGQKFGSVVNQNQILVPHHFFVENTQNDVYAVRVVNIHPKGENISIWSPKYEATALSLSGQVSPESCPDCNDGEISLSISGGSCPYQISWQHGASSEKISALQPGTYHVSIQDQAGNNISQSFTVDPFPCTLAFGEIEIDEPQCFGNRNGRISVEVIGAQGPLTFLWNGVSGSVELNEIIAGSYQLELSDSVGCRLDSTFILSQPEALTIAPNIEHESCNNCENGRIALNISGGTPSYNITWNDGATGPTRNGLKPGVYSYEIQDINACSLDGSIEIEGFICPEITLTASIEEPNCWNSEDGQIQVNIAGSNYQPFEYKWNGLNGTELLGNIGAGSYDLEFTDNKGCSVDSSFTLNAPDEIVVESIISNESCFECKNGRADLTVVSGGYPPYSYLWPDASTAEQRDDLAPGSYNVKVLDSRDCEQEVLVKILKHGCELEILDIDATEPSCYGFNDGELSVDYAGIVGSPSIVWSTGDTLIYSSNLEAGQYWVVVSDGGACKDSASIELSEPSPLTVDLTFVEESCIGCADYKLRAEPQGGTAPYTFIWNGLEDEQEINVSSGSYEILVLDQNACSTRRDTSLDVSTSIRENANYNIISAPNPFSDRLLISSPDRINIKLIDSQGRVHIQEIVDGKQVALNTETLGTGVYILEISGNGKEIAHRKLVKQ